MPHPIFVDGIGASLLADRDHSTVDMGWHTGDHVLWWIAQSVNWPVLADQVEVVADATRGDDHSLGVKLEVVDPLAVAGFAPVGSVGLEHAALDTDRRTLLDQHLIDPMTMVEGDLPGPLSRLDRLQEDPDDLRPGAPSEVEAGHRVAVPVRSTVSALGPASEGHYPQTQLAEVVVFVARSELDVRLGPLSGPVIFLAVELGRAHPVGQRQLDGVLDAPAPLLRRVDEEQASQRPEGLAAAVVGILLVEHDHMLARLDEFVGRNEAGQAGAHDDRVCLCSS